jgi:ubiquinone biosynthesis protein COQ9
MQAKPLPKPLQSRVNRLAHRIAGQQEQRIKSEMLERLQTAREAGATLEELMAIIAAREPSLTDVEQD